jgi:type I restriction enzyme S subunit
MIGTRLSNVCEITMGQAPEGASYNFDGNGLPLLAGAGDFGDLFPSPSKFTTSPGKISKTGDIIVCIRATIGDLNWSDKEYCLGRGVAGLRPKNKELDTQYLWNWLRASKDKLEKNAKGSTFKQISRDDIASLQIPLPPLDEQKRIAGILDKADAIRRKRAESLKLLDELLRATFLDMFGDPITNPKGWPRVKLGTMCTIRRGASPRPISEYLGGNVPWIKIGDGSTGDPIYISETQDKIIREGVAKSVYLEPGALIFANCGVSLGFARILKIAGCIHDGWLSLEGIKPELNQLYLLKLINHLSEHFRKIAPSGTQPNLITGIMKNYEIPLPPIHKQIEFAAIVEKAGLSQIAYENACVDAENLFHSLVSRAFKGEL